MPSGVSRGKRHFSKFIGIMLALALAFILPAVPASAVDESEFRLPPSLVSFERTSPDPIHLSGETTFKWKSTGPAPTSIYVGATDGLGYSRSAYADPRGVFEGTISLPIPYDSYPSRYEVTSIQIRSGDKSVSYYPAGRFSKFPSGLDDPKPNNINFTALGFTSKKMNLLNYGYPEIGGEIAETPMLDVRVGAKLTALHPGWGPLPLAFTYQWWKDEEKIVGATGATYSVKPEDSGANLSIAVTASKPNYVTATEFAQYHVVLPAELSALTPTITGAAALGSTLTANPGTWGPAPVNYSYVWLRSGTPIVGATGKTYTLTDADVDKPITVSVTGSKQFHETVSRTSKSTPAVTLRQFNPQLPKISGEVRVGSTLTAAPGVWAPEPVTFRYWWSRDGYNIPSATGPTYQLTANDLGKTITVMVEGSKTGYDHFPMTSDPTAKVAAGSLTSPVPTISGKPKLDEFLTVNPGPWGPGQVSLSYQWYRDGQAMLNSSDEEYYLKPTDSGTTITVSVTGIKHGYAGVTKTSAPVIMGHPWIESQTPTISGTVEVGAKLSASLGQVPADVKHIEYQWFRSGTAIRNAIDAEYILNAADAGKLITVRATGIEGGYQAPSELSAPTAAVGSGLLSSSVPALSGTNKVGNVLWVNPGKWTTDTTFEYQWYRSGVAIKNMPESSYVLAAADVGKRITVKVTGTKAGYASASSTSKATAAIAKGSLASSTPKITGTNKVGNKLKADAGKWTSGTTLNYQWYCGGSAIKGATKTSYLLVGTDAGKRITVKVTGTKTGYATVAKTSKATAAITKAKLTSSTPKITGTKTVGHKLKAATGKWTSGTTLKYQWYRSGSAIKGATKASHALVGADAGKRITVKVTGTKTGYTTVAKISSRTTAIAKGSLASSSPKITGTTKVGNKLKATAGKWTSGTKLKYQWYRGGSGIKGATGKSYKLPKSTRRYAIKVKVTGSKSGYVSVTKTSKSTAKIR